MRFTRGRRGRHHGTAGKSSIALAVGGLLALVLLTAGFARLNIGDATADDRPIASAPTLATPVPATPVAEDSLPDQGAAISLPAVGLTASLSTITFEGNTLAPPEDVSTAGIWGDGAPFSADGVAPTVVTGHVSDDADRPGEFGKLKDVEVGDEVVTSDAEGRLRHWQVTDRTLYDKASLPRSLFLSSERRLLHLITCDERVEFDGGGFHYSGNLVVTAVPLD